jgi:hypothetical protein
MRSYRAGLAIAFLSVAGLVGPAFAASVTVTPAVQKECQWDYNEFCNQYGLGTELLDMCFKSNGAKLSKGCVEALIGAGDVSQEYVTRQKELLGR